MSQKSLSDIEYSIMSKVKGMMIEADLEDLFTKLKEMEARLDQVYFYYVNE
jgi:membrane carboxypeptidase/penicillin-binding protein